MAKDIIQYKIAIDADEVLWGCIPHFLEYYNQRYGTDFGLENFRSQDWAAALEADPEHVSQSYLDFHESGLGYQLRPITGSLEALRLIRQHLTNPPIVISARLAKLRAETEWLIDQHFPEIFADIQLGDHFGPNRRSKAEICQEHQIDILIEDDLKHALPASAVVEEVLLFGDYPWTRATDLPANVKPVKNWSAVLTHLNLAAEV